MHWSVRSIVVLQIKHHLTSPPSSYLTQIYTMQRLEVQPNYIYHILGLNFITQVLHFKVPRCLTIYPRLSESYRRGSYLEMPCLDTAEILTCRTSYCTIHRMELYFHYFEIVVVNCSLQTFCFCFCRDSKSTVYCIYSIPVVKWNSIYLSIYLG